MPWNNSDIYNTRKNVENLRQNQAKKAGKSLGKELKDSYHSLPQDFQETIKQPTQEQEIEYLKDGLGLDLEEETDND